MVKFQFTRVPFGKPVLWRHGVALYTRAETVELLQLHVNLRGAHDTAVAGKLESWPRTANWRLRARSPAEPPVKDVLPFHLTVTPRSTKLCVP